MKKISSEIQYVVSNMGASVEEARLNMRIKQVRDRYKEAIQSVYRESARIHLEHTNNVIITVKNGVKTLIVYVDDSLFAAELNAQRELIKLKLLELFGEDIDDFQIKTSKWKKYKEQHPYKEEEDSQVSEITPSVPLDNDEKLYVKDTASMIDDEKVRESLEKAMKADMEWKKGERV